jgi:hypothetical protein
MITIKPRVDIISKCPSCDMDLVINDNIIFQGVHICYEGFCPQCKKTFLRNLPIGQGKLVSLSLTKFEKKEEKKSNISWFFDPFRRIYQNPKSDEISFEIIKRRPTKNKVVLLNTLDNCYGHSLLYFLNLQNIIDQKQSDTSIVVLIQPFLLWLLPDNGIDEIWLAHVSFSQMREYLVDLNKKINIELLRFDTVQLSQAHLCPTDIRIEKFSKIVPYDFVSPPEKPRISFIWRDDLTRLWIKSHWIYSAMRKLRIAKILLPLHFLRVLCFVSFLHYKFGNRFQITLTGLGKTCKFPSFIADERVEKFNKETEIHCSKIYAQSILAIGVHGSGMILPSAHAGMTISIMPMKRWGNFAEDILFSENDTRLAAFQKRVIPMNTSLFETLDICENMLTGRSYFIKKFIYDKTVL